MLYNLTDFFMTYKEEMNQSIETDTELTQIGESADKDIKRSIITVFPIE